MGTISDKLLKLQATKTAIKAAIEAKGVTVPTGTTFGAYAIKIGEITGADASGWVRPADWLPMPTVSETEQKVVILMAIHEDANFVAFNISGGSIYSEEDNAYFPQPGDYTVDWGDGTVQNFTSGATAQREILYSSISPSTQSSRGYRQALITITPKAGHNLGYLDFHVNHSITTAVYDTKFLDVLISAPNCGGFNLGPVNISAKVAHRSCERVHVKSIGALAFIDSMFRDCSSLQSVPLFNTASVTHMINMFLGCSSLQSVPLFNTAAVTSMINMFRDCSSLQSVPLFNTASVVQMGGMFSGCFGLQSVPLFNTAAVTSMNDMFTGCSSLQSAPAFNLARVSSSANFVGAFASNPSLSKFHPTGIRFTFSLANCKLSAARLNEVFTNLPTVTGQTITITGNYGAATCDRAIATSKGWTVVG